MLFKKKVLSSSVALALVGSTMPAFAQDEGLEIEEVIVEGGIRASLKKSMDIKRDTVGVADAISAEDMGKFPDTNLAEALQRITGVSIDRARGEGSKVTVRGFGPEYNMVTLNGRQMPTHSGTSRAFDFADIASEGISAVVIHKTGDAAAPSGGIGSVINILTTKPLEAGSVLSVGAKAAIDTSTILGDDFTPEIAGLFSETFADDTVGISLSFSGQKRNNAERFGNVGGWRSHFASAENARLGVPADVVGGNRQLNRPELGDHFDASCDVDVENCQFESISIPQSVAYNLSEYESKRVNGQLTMQWRPIESLTGTIDYTYSQLDLDKSYNDLSAWFNGQGANSQTAHWDDQAISTPLMYREVGSNNDFAMGIGQEGFTNTNESVGLNLEWYASDRLQLEFDWHKSDAHSGANSPFGTGALVTMASYNRTVSKVYFTEDFPILELGLNPADANTVQEGGEARPLYKDDMVITGSVFGNGESLMDIDQKQFSGTYDLNDVTSIDFGVALTEVTNRSVSSNVQRDTWGGISDPGYISGILERTTMEDNFDALSGGNNELRQIESFAVDFKELTDVARMLPVTEVDSIASGTCVPEPFRDFYCASTDWTVDKTTTEESKAAYFQITHDTEISDLPTNIRVGVRYEETDVISLASVPKYVNSSWTGGNEFNLIPGDEIIEEPMTGNYDFVLPNIDINVEFTDELVGRMSVSKTVTRPNYEDIKGGTTANGTSYKGKPSASRGSPGLLPIESTNFDLSTEWYYNDVSYLSVGYFKKATENFIGSNTDLNVAIPEWEGLTDVASGGKWEEAAILGGLTDPATIQTAIKEYLPFVPTSDNPLMSDETNDPLLFSISYPVNQKDANVYGWEFNIQHNFGETGYGVIANYTRAWSDVGYVAIPTTEPCPDELIETTAKCMISQFALSGLSDSANLIAFYDKDGFNARIAYNWRDDFFNGDGQGQGAFYDDDGERRIGNNPTQTQAYGQVDISASYEFSDNLSVFIDGINVTNEGYRLFGRTERQTLRSGQTGARYNLGVRYTF